MSERVWCLSASTNKQWWYHLIFILNLVFLSLKWWNNYWAWMIWQLNTLMHKLISCHRNNLLYHRTICHFSIVKCELKMYFNLWWMKIRCHHGLGFTEQKKIINLPHLEIELRNPLSEISVAYLSINLCGSVLYRKRKLLVNCLIRSKDTNINSPNVVNLDKIWIVLSQLGKIHCHFTVKRCSNNK